MKVRIKILMLEHDPNDIGLLQDELEHSGLDYILQVVQTREHYEKALDSGHPDIILADYTFPSFDGLSAFRARQKISPATPFIMVSGTIGEENAVELIKMGVTDYVLKEKMYQITTKIQRALQEASDRKKKEVAERQLSQREEQLQKIMDLSLDVICTLDEEGRFITVGAASKVVWGYLPEELIGRMAIDLVHEEDKERTFQAVADLRNGFDMVNFENRCIHKAGVVVTILWSVGWDPNGKIGYSVARDATDIKKAEEKIRHNEKRFRTLLQNSTDGLTLLAADGTVIERTLAAQKILGLAAGENPGEFKINLVHPEDAATLKQACTQVQQNAHAMVTVEHRMCLPDGSYKWLETTFHNQLQEPAVEAVVLNFRDITQSKTAALALKRSEARLKEAQALGHIGYWETDWTDGTTLWSDEMYPMFGVNKKDFKLTSASYASFIHPGDLAAVLARLEKASASLEKDAMTLRIVQPGGQVRYLTSEVHFEVDAQGRPLRLFGIHQDVTDRKLAEIALEKSEEKYRSLFKSSPTPMWVYEVDTLQFLDVNEAAIKQYGYPKEEFLALTWSDIRHATEIRKGAGIGQPRQKDLQQDAYITKLVKKGGEVLDVDLNDSFIDLGDRQARLVIATDISERVKYIKAIKEQNLRLREIAWIQSHVVRAPLARMMGLVELLKQHPPEQVPATQLLSFLSDSAHELDAIIRDIVRKTEQLKD